MATLLLLLSVITSSYAADPIRVAVVDTGLDLDDPRFTNVLCEHGHQDFTGTGIKDTDGHGTHVAGIIKQYAQNANYCLMILKFWTPGNKPEHMTAALEWAIAVKADIVNISAGGVNGNAKEERLLYGAPRTLFVAAAGNAGLDIGQHPFYPAAYPFPHVVAVGALTRKGERARFSNYGERVKTWELGELVGSYLPRGRVGQMSGTSMAAAVHTGKIVYEVSRNTRPRNKHLLPGSNWLARIVRGD
jgi:subtilisin family serine protease